MLRILRRNNVGNILDIKSGRKIFNGHLIEKSKLEADFNVVFKLILV